MKTTHVYVNDREHAALDRVCDELGMSASAVFRLGLRMIAGLPVPSRVRELVLDELNSADETPTALAR